MRPALRDYQERAVTMLRARHRDRPLLCLPTGSGKTSVAAEIIRSAVDKGRRAVFLVHRRELVEQAVERLAQWGVEAGRILAGHKEKLELPVQVASIPTLIRREHWPAEVVIVDECAHAVSATWSEVINRYDGSTVVGLTATPIRLDGRGLGDLFGCIVEPVTTMALIEQGYLVEPQVFAPPVDLKGVKVKRGDYSIPELAERMNKLVGSLTETWMTRAQGQRTVVFAVNVDHSMRIVEAFRDLDVRAEHIDYQMNYRKRADTLRSLREGDLDMVSQVMILSEGWDLPDLQCAVLARPTKSLALFRQQVGRVMRLPGPVLVLDHAGNHHEHGAVTDEIEWSLDSEERTMTTTEGLRTCPECYAVIPPSCTLCPSCGAELEAADEVDPPGIENEGELVEFTQRLHVALEDKKRAYTRFVHVANERNYKLAWARCRYREDFGVWPRFRAIEREEYVCRGHEYETKEYGRRTVRRCARCYEEAGYVAT